MKFDILALTTMPLGQRLFGMGEDAGKFYQRIPAPEGAWDWQECDAKWVPTLKRSREHMTQRDLSPHKPRASREKK